MSFYFGCPNCGVSIDYFDAVEGFTSQIPVVKTDMVPAACEPDYQLINQTCYKNCPDGYVFDDPQIPTNCVPSTYTPDSKQCAQPLDVLPPFKTALPTKQCPLGWVNINEQCYQPCFGDYIKDVNGNPVFCSLKT